jgi:hypothetical protein
MSRNQYGPEARGNARTGPGMLSVEDGISPTPDRIDGQGAKPGPAVIRIVVHPVANRPGYFEARRADGERVIAASRAPFSVYDGRQCVGHVVAHEHGFAAIDPYGRAFPQLFATQADAMRALPGRAA